MRCREYARAKGYEVERVFADPAVSGGVIDRPGMNAMLAYLRARKKSGQYVVLIDDISRLARSIRAHLELRSAIDLTGARLESPSIDFGEDSDAQLIEHLLATVSGHQREKNAEQVRNRMSARLIQGRWPFSAPLGYQHGGEKGVLVRREPVASIIQEALEGFASGRFQSQAEVKRFLEDQPGMPKSKAGYLGNQLVPNILSNPIYAGYVEKDDWGVSLRKGLHKGLISFETFQKIQEVLSGKNRAPVRVDVSDDFPLRGAVSCAHCGKPLTSCWSTSKSGVKHPYYLCFSKGCDRKGKSIPRARIEGEFAQVLERLTPSARLLSLTKAMFKSAWEQRSAQAVAIKRSYEDELGKVDRQIEALIERVVDASSTVAAAYEKRIDELERGKVVIREKIAGVGKTKGTFAENFEHAFGFLANPAKLWISGSLAHRRLALRMTFSDRLEWSPETGFRTPKTTMPFSMLEGTSGSFDGLAEREGNSIPRHFYYIFNSLDQSFRRLM